MQAIRSLNLEQQWIYRCLPPKGQLKFDFSLDEESLERLSRASENYRGEAEVEGFEKAVKDAAIYTVLTIDGKELKSRQIEPYIRLVIDPTNRSRVFGFQIKTAPDGEKLLITKAQVFQLI